MADSMTNPITERVTTMNSHHEQLSRVLDRIKQSLTRPQSTSAEHAQTLADISRLQLAVETPLETIYRIGHQTWQNAGVRIALELGIFDSLQAKNGAPVGIHELASASGADAVFLAAARLPEYMRSQNYQNPTQSTNSAFTYATGSEFWTHLNGTPVHSHIFNEFMATRRQGRKSWYDIYPVGRELSNLPNADTDVEKERKVLIVDVGGNRGHDLVELRARNPQLVGKMILQDLPDVVANTSFDPDDNMAIEAMPHDFFQPQPIRHALAYHFRAIFHDWPDSACHHILSHTAAAMRRNYSKLLISEFVLPDMDTALFPATLDIQMMGLHAGMERSEKQWRTLLDSAGLKVVKIWQDVKGGEGVIEATLI
ncbi:MAG: hypothetical protein Q9184_005341 [Pyrenodesmia sp. 2 TL-2023]